MRPIIICLIACMLTSCSIFRKVDKNSHKTSSQTELQTSTKTNLDDRTTTKITETTDTSVVVPGQKISGQSSGTTIRTVINGDTLTANYDVKKNLITAQFTAKPKSVTVQGKKVTETNNNIQKEVVEKVDSSTKTATKDFTKHVEEKSNSTLFWIIIIAVIGAAIFVAFKYFRKYLPF